MYANIKDTNDEIVFINKYKLKKLENGNVKIYGRIYKKLNKTDSQRSLQLLMEIRKLTLSR